MYFPGFLKWGLEGGLYLVGGEKRRKNAVQGAFFSGIFAFSRHCCFKNEPFAFFEAFLLQKGAVKALLGRELKGVLFSFLVKPRRG